MKASNTARNLQQKRFGFDDGGDSDGCVTAIIETSHRGNTKEKTAYNISDYRTACRTCKDMEVEEYEKLNVKKTYKRTNILSMPTSGFTKIKKQNSTIGNTMRPAKASIDLEKAREKLNAAKGKVAPMTRYNVTQLKKQSLDRLIEIILLL